jgi:hypothetical protein
MKARSLRLNVESLDGRIVPSTVAHGDINHDGRDDMAAITASKTITVSLGTANGYSVSATLTAQNGPSLQHVDLVDRNGDGNLDVAASGSSSTWHYTHTWLGNGDGTFGSLSTTRWRFPRNWV